MDITSLAGNSVPVPGRAQGQDSAPPSSTDSTSATQNATPQNAAPQNTQAVSTDGSATQKDYQSPVVSFDAVTGDPVLQFRNTDTGEQTFQVPSRQSLEYARNEQLAKDSPDSASVQTA